jgi:hypothetical protein
MFRFGGDFTFGRNFYATGHSLLLSNYVDAVKYYKRTGDVDLAFYSIYDCHRGSFKDDGGVNYRNIWAITAGTKYRDHDLYLNLFAQDNPNLSNRQGLQAFVLGNTVAGQQTKDNRWDVEFGSKGPIGKSGHWDYDLGFAYTDYQLDVKNIGATTFISPELQAWQGHAAVKWDSKREWAAKLGYTFATEESVGGISLDNDRRYDDGIETPYEDISRGNNYFRNGLYNMYTLKLQIEYRPRNTKHYFRLAGEMLDELNDTTTNEIARYAQGHGAIPVPANFVKTNTAYDNWNNYGVADPKTTVMTFEYRYQLAENTRIRVGYTAFDMTGNAVSAIGAVPAIKAGRGQAGDYDYNMFWAELYSRF